MAKLKMINKTYLDSNVIDQMKTSLAKNGFLRLDNFLDDKEYTSLLKELEKGKGKKLKVPDLYSYEKLDKLNGFSFKEFFDFINEFYRLKKRKINIKKFKWRDYTLFNDLDFGKKEYKSFYFVCKTWKSDFGGSLIYTDKKNKTLIFPVIGNSFFIVKTNEGKGKFVKYINHLAKKRSFFLIEFE